MKKGNHSEKKDFIQKLRAEKAAHRSYDQDHYKIVMQEQRLTAKTALQPEHITYIVKKQSPFQSLKAILANNTLDIAESSALSQALLKAYEDQITSQNISHNALEPNTIMIDRTDPMSPQISLVDFSSVKPKKDAEENSDYKALMTILHEIWQKASPNTSKLSAECQQKLGKFEADCEEIFKKPPAIKP